VLRRDCQDHSVGPGDSREHLADLDEVLRRDCQDRWVGPDDSREHLAHPGDFQGRLADPDDWLVDSAVPDARRDQLDSDHRELRVVKVEPERAVRREPFSPEAVLDELLRQDRRLDHRWDDSPADYKPLADESRLPDGS
jgi:hypothetical protein